MERNLSVPNLGKDDDMVNLGDTGDGQSIQNQKDDVWIQDSVDGGSRKPLFSKGKKSS